MTNIWIALLAILGLSTGGCSIYYLLLIGPLSIVLVYAIPGLIISAMCFWGARTLHGRS